MASLLRRLTSPAEQRSSTDQWLSEYLLPALDQFVWGGATYPFGQTLQGSKVREIAGTLPAYTAALSACPPAFAAEMVRSMVLSQARFTFRNRPGSPTPRRLWGNTALQVLETPWPNGTTGELISRMEWHAGLAGNAFVTSFQPGRLRVLRPDWVAIMYGSKLEPESPAHALDGEIVGYIYQQGGVSGYNPNRIYSLLPSEVAHWSPLPDPEKAGLGMSWITPALNEIRGDQAATQHKLMFYANGATPNMVVTGLPGANKELFDRTVAMLEEKHTGLANAYRTLYLTAGADAKVVGSDLRGLDFKANQGAGETRIASLSRVPAAVLGLSEGLAGSSLNAGNYAAARRTFADSWVYPSLQDLAGSLAPLVKVPADSELWFDVVDMPFLREDAKDAADIVATNATSISTLTLAGYTPESVTAAVAAGDLTLLKHGGMLPVQLHPPGSAPPSPNGNGKPAAVTA